MAKKKNILFAEQRLRNSQFTQKRNSVEEIGSSLVYMSTVLVSNAHSNQPTRQGGNMVPRVQT